MRSVRGLLRRLVRPGIAAVRAPVRFDARHDHWVVAGYDNAKAALTDWRGLSSCPLAGIDFALLGADPPAHDRIRRIVARHFDGATLEPIVRSIEALAPQLVGPRFDIVEDYSIPLVRHAAGRFVGLTEKEIAEVLAAVEAGRATAGRLTMPDPLPGPVRRAAIRTALRDEAGELLDEAALDSLVALLCLAATDTSLRAIPRAALSMLADPALRERVAADPALLGRFVEEILRLYPPTPVILRTATRPVEIGGACIPAGAAVRVNVISANRDPARFDAPDALRLDRVRNPHLAFGIGVHQCLGSGMARRVIAAAMTALLAHRPPLRLLEPAESVRFAPPESIAVPLRLMVGHD